jgi:hypothetical protein
MADDVKPTYLFAVRAEEADSIATCPDFAGLGTQPTVI